MKSTDRTFLNEINNGIENKIRFSNIKMHPYTKQDIQKIIFFILIASQNIKSCIEAAYAQDRMHSIDTEMVLYDNLACHDIAR